MNYVTRGTLPDGIPSDRVFNERCRSTPALGAVKVGKCWVCSVERWHTVFGRPGAPDAGLDAAIRARFAKS